MPTTPDIQAVLRQFRAHAEGILRCGEVPEPVRFVISRSDHAVIFPLDRRLLEEPEFLLCLPDDSFDMTLRLLLDLTPLVHTREIDQDRHLAYHGSTREKVWVQGIIDHAHAASGVVVDGELLSHPSPLADDEPRLCKQLNADQSALRDATELLTGVRVPDPLAVGVDPHGFDIRARLGIVRVEFPSVCADAQTAARVIRTLLSPPIPSANPAPPKSPDA